VPEEVSVERRHHNPYRHWASGFLFEVALFVAFLAILVGGALVIMRAVG
jgi:hypothetical protein